MSHEFESGFFTRKAAWHGLGEVLDFAPSNWKEALAASGLGWHVSKRPLMFVAPSTELENPIIVSHSTEQFALVRDTDNSVLGYCKNAYMPLQNAEAFPNNNFSAKNKLLTLV